MSQQVIYRSRGMGFVGFLMCLLIGLKLAGVAAISWWTIALVPVIAIVFGIIGWTLFFLIAGLLMLWSRK